jgi:hypothetical protein
VLKLSIMENDHAKRRKRGPRRPLAADEVNREADQAPPVLPSPTAQATFALQQGNRAGVVLSVSRGVIVPPMQEQPDHPPPFVSSGGGALSGQGNFTAALADVLHPTDAFTATVLPKKPKASPRLVIRNREQVVAYSNIIISSLQEALDYDPARHHNQPPPELRLGDARYLRDVRDLIAELKRLKYTFGGRSPAAER